MSGRPELLAQGVAEQDAARGARPQVEDALALQGSQVILGSVGRLEAERLGDFGAGGRHALLVHGVLDETQDLSLARGEIVHGGSCMYKQ